MQELSLRTLKLFSGVGPVQLWESSTALLLIDMQISCVGSDGFSMRRMRECGLDEAIEQYRNQLQAVIPNLARLLARARENGQTIVHAHFVTVPGKQVKGQLRGAQNSERRWAPPGSREAQIIDELQPEPGELVMPKDCSGVFAGTNLDLLLRRLGVKNLIVGGVVTNACVEQSITHGHDLGYGCVLVSDGSAALTDELHQNALERLGHRRAHVLSTEELLNRTSIPGAE